MLKCMAKHRDHEGALSSANGVDDTQEMPLPQPPLAYATRLPTNRYAFGAWLLERFGILAAFVVILCAFIYWRETNYAKATAAAHQEYKAVLEKIADSVEKMTAEQAKTNVELARTNVLLDAHLQSDRDHHR